MIKARFQNALSVVGAMLLLLASAFAQQATVGVGMRNVGDGFAENMGVGFGFRTPNGGFANGGMAPAAGGLNPNGGATLGFGFGGSGFNGFLNLAAAQASSRSSSSTAMSLTVPNGGTGFIADVVQEPFVVSFVPVVGGFVNESMPQFGTSHLAPMGGNGPLLNERLARIRETGGLNLTGNNSSSSGAPIDRAEPKNAGVVAGVKHDAIAEKSSAARPIASIAEIRRQQAEEDRAIAKEVQSLLDQGRKAQDAGNIKLARAYFRQAIPRATGDLRVQAQEALHSLGDSGSSR
jgi:hypothetical protein